MRTETERRVAADRIARAVGSEPTAFRTTIRTHIPEVFRGVSFEMEPALAREFVDWVAETVGCKPSGHEDREVYVTPFPGHCGLAGYVITVDGTPCRLFAYLMLGSLEGDCILPTFDGHHVEGLGRGASGAMKAKQASLELVEYIKRMGLPAKAEVAMCDVSPLYQSRQRPVTCAQFDTRSSGGGCRIPR